MRSTFHDDQKGIPGAGGGVLTWTCDGDGQTLAFGSFRISDDQGATPGSASEHQPPVWCVRFSA
jgi:hypothetical protein